jgi:5-methylcytosine-specific restriction enzyme subunit McrC
MKSFTVYEHQHFIPDEPRLFDALTAFHGDKANFPYYTLTRHGIRLGSYVGVLNLGEYSIEVLPKIDRENDNTDWRNVLINMLRESGVLRTDAPSQANLKLKQNSILELYIERFVNECSYLLKRGLVKTYRQTEGNKPVMKGALVFNRHIALNAVHRERFYTRHSTYDADHTLNQLLAKCLRLISTLHLPARLQGTVSSLLLNFPEVHDLRVSERTFEQLVFNRKTEVYRAAIDIARMLLLNYHPDLISGRNHVLALMFDMNVLWEAWVVRQLRRHAPEGVSVEGQSSKVFWRSSSGWKTLRPDIIITYPDQSKVIFDTKWKIPRDGRPDDSDLKQMFAYTQVFSASKAYLLYPGSAPHLSGHFYDTTTHCGLLYLHAVRNGKLDVGWVGDVLGLG